MQEREIFHSLKRETPYREWSPGIHYAQFQNLQPCSFPERRLYDFELLYVRQGKLTTKMNGTRHALTSGQLIFLSPGVYHQNSVLKSPTKLLGIHFDFFGESRILREEDMVVNEEEVVPEKFAVEAIAAPFLPLSEEPVYAPPPECIHAMEQLVQEFTMRPPGYELVCRGLMLGILTSLLRTQSSRRLAKASVHGERIRALIEEIEAAPAQGWTNRSMAALMNLHEDHFSKLFRQIAGMPPGEYLRSIRHREARKLLRETDWTIERVGERVGYPDIHYFSRTFSSHEGISPRAYRKLSRIL
ncbi:AraC-like ligand binding domain-containing protein [Paenibacillus sophorae]|uniref:AraC family transcriptional regulator n=1 Tax=Paenibacillus sophorae TaxID=1333845 RepID=A0A1H8M5H3_9BACL|nr:AraC family transcriptional regulator [Paenibacillus sophorae]QWU17679.1 AraC family transcriptional regulator [Paenibacillus sophorae]SEO12579.1 AraC-like ligand binding domain-containing protein [Paenibacillus sophorae]